MNTTNFIEATRRVALLNDEIAALEIQYKELSKQLSELSARSNTLHKIRAKTRQEQQEWDQIIRDADKIESDLAQVLEKIRSKQTLIYDITTLTNPR